MASSESTLKKTRKGGVLLLGGSGLSQVCDFITVVILAQHLGVRGFGLFVGVRAIAGLVGYLTSTRSWELLLAFWARIEEELGRLPKGLYLLSLFIEACAMAVAFVVLAVIAPLLTEHVPVEDLRTCLLLALVRPGCGNLVMSNQAVLRLIDRFGLVAGVVALPGMCRLAAITLAIALSSELSIGDALLAEAIGSTVALSLGMLLVPWGLGGIRLARDRISTFGKRREMWQFGVANWSASSVKAGTTYGAEVALLAVGTPEGLGVFGLARRVAGMLSAVLDPLGQAYQPEIYRLVARHDVAALRKYLFNMTRDFTVLCTLLIIGIAVFREQIFLLVGGEEFEKAGPVVLIIMLGFGLHLSLAWLKPTILAHHKPQVIVVAQIAVGVGLITMTLLLVPHYSAQGAAWGVCAGYMVQVAIWGKVVTPWLRLNPSQRAPE